MRPTLSRRSFLAAAAAAPLSAEVQMRAGGAEPSTKDLRRSQLFLDDTWIEETSRLERVWESAGIFPEPVLRPDKPWEGNQVIMFGSVLKLGSEWRMYYMTYNRPAPMYFCMATSSDGTHWQKPELGIAEWNGSKANNILWAPSGGQNSDGCTVCHDPADPDRPFKLMYYGYGGGRTSGEYVAFSKDGLAWRHHPGPVLTSTGDRTNLLPGRDHRGRYVAYLRHRNMMSVHRARTVWMSESEDFLRWSEPSVILRPDLLDDANTELYGMSGVPYADMYLGMLERWRGNPDVIEVQLAWSHDGRNWRRPAVRKPFIAPTYPWNRAWNSCANTAPIRVGNKLWFFFGGRSGAHGREQPTSYGAIGLATVTVDRFAAIRADYKEGRCITRPMKWPGGDLVLNCTHTRYPEGHPTGGGGSIRVEVTGDDHAPIPGFSGQQAAQHNVVSPAPWETRVRPVLWPQKRSLNELAGRSIRLVFYLADASLYSFRAGE